MWPDRWSREHCPVPCRFDFIYLLTNFLPLTVIVMLPFSSCGALATLKWVLLPSTPTVKFAPLKLLIGPETVCVFVESPSTVCVR